MKTAPRPLSATPVILALLALLPCAARAQEKPPALCPAIDVPAAIAPRLRVFVDPATGRLREPTADELRQIAEERLAARRAAAPRVFEVVTHPDGMQSVDLGDAFLFDVRLETLPDGTTRLDCVPHGAPPSGAPRQ
jgi:hypothetical protein